MTRTYSALSTMTVVLAVLSLFASAQVTPASTTPPDYNLYTSYFFGSGYQSVGWVVCGSTAQSEGCYASGSLEPFGRVGAMIEGNPFIYQNLSTVIRFIYVVDVAAGPGGNGVTLSVYKKTDIVSSSSDTVTVILDKTVALPLTGGSAAICSMAANNGFLFIGTNMSPYAVRVEKNNLTVEEVGGFSPPSTVSSITSDRYGYVTVTFGNGMYQFGPDGEGVGDGGGTWFMLDTFVGLSSYSFPILDSIPADRLQVRPKKNAPAPPTQ